GAGGTSLPHFLQHLITNPIGLESEYSRLLLEQGLVGLALWVAFGAWVLTRRGPPPREPWRLGWRLGWWNTLANLALAAVGTGLMTAIPNSVLLFLGMGFVAAARPTPPPPPGPARRPADARAPERPRERLAASV